MAVRPAVMASMTALSVRSPSMRSQVVGSPMWCGVLRFRGRHAVRVASADGDDAAAGGELLVPGADGLPVIPAPGRLPDLADGEAGVGEQPRRPIRLGWFMENGRFRGFDPLTHALHLSVGGDAEVDPFAQTPRRLRGPVGRHFLAGDEEHGPAALVDHPVVAGGVVVGDGEEIELPDVEDAGLGLVDALAGVLHDGAPVWLEPVIGIVRDLPAGSPR